MNKTWTTRCRLKYLLVVTLALWGIGMITDNGVRAQNYSGLSLKLYGNDPANTTNEYRLESDPDNPDDLNSIKLLLVLKNISGQKINVKRGFSQAELYRALKVTDPCGIPLELVPDESAFAASAGMPRFVGGRPLIPAEVLKTDFARSLKISDLRKLFPVMYHVPGTYRISAQLPGARFFVTQYSPERGLEGLANHFSNWFGTINADFGLDPEGKLKRELPILILPDSGGRLKITVEKEDARQIQPLFGTPVKVFAGSIAEDPAIAWDSTDVEPVLTGASGISGVVKWDCNRCLPQGTYTVLAQYQDDIGAAEVTESDPGWGEKCTGLVEGALLFRQPPLVADTSFSVFGLNSVKIDKQAVVLSGDVGSNAVEGRSEHYSRAKPGPRPGHRPGPRADAGVTIGKGAALREGTRIFANWVKIEKDAVVYDVYYNELENKGRILGEMITPLELPVWEVPVFLESEPGSEDVKVKGRKGDGVVELAAGAYDKVEIGHDGQLQLSGGTYHFSRLKMDKDAALVCLAPATILVAEGLEGHDQIYIGPAAGSGISAADIVFYFGGIEDQEGKKKKSESKIKKVLIGKKSRIMANIYAPNSTLEIKKESEVQGSLVAAEVKIDDKATVEYNGSF